MKNIGDSVIHIGSSYTYSKYDLGELMLFAIGGSIQRSISM